MKIALSSEHGRGSTKWSGAPLLSSWYSERVSNSPNVVLFTTVSPIECECENPKYKSLVYVAPLSAFSNTTKPSALGKVVTPYISVEERTEY